MFKRKQPNMSKEAAFFCRMQLHNLTQPLTAILGLTSILKNKGGDDIKDDVTAIEDAGQLVANIVKEMQRYIYNEGDVKRQLQPYTSKELESYLREHIPRLARENGIEYELGEFDLKTGNKKIWIDTDFMNETIWNMVTNSREANATHLLNSYKADSEHLCVSFKDNGDGMDEETVKKCMNIGFTTKQKGDGIGLAFIHDYISRLNGYVEIKSSPGWGSEFRLYQPLYTLHIGEEMVGDKKDESRR